MYLSTYSLHVFVYILHVLVMMAGEVFPGSLDIDPKEASSSRYSETETSPPYVSEEFPGEYVCLRADSLIEHNKV